jgi:Tfp pilus assembly protein PilO
MNKNATPLLLIILAVGIYFSFTRTQINDLQSIQLVNAQYKEAIYNSKSLIKVRDDILDTYNKIDLDNQDRLEKLIPDNVDNVRLIIDVNGIASRHGMSIKNIKTTTPNDTASSQGVEKIDNNKSLYNTVVLSFDVTGSYSNFVAFIGDIESSLRILEVSKITLKGNDTPNYDYNVELKTFWLKQ